MVAFTEGKSLSDIAKAREEGKRPYQKVLTTVGAITLLVTVIMVFLLR